MNLSQFAEKPELIKVLTDCISATILNFTKIQATSSDLVKKSQRQAYKNDVASIIRFEGSDLKIELVIGFPSELIFKLAEIFFQTTEADAAIAQDLAGEILNIAFGTIDPSFSMKGIKLKSSFPHKFSNQHAQQILKKAPENCLFIPFTALEKKFFLEIHEGGAIPLPWKYTPVKK